MVIFIFKKSKQNQVQYHVSLNKTFKGFLPERKKYLASFSQYPPINEISSIDWGEAILRVPENKRRTKRELNHLIIAEKDIEYKEAEEADNSFTTVCCCGAGPFS